ncbi:Type II secretory pathway, pseudopilin PulG [Granulicatella balaenopterae]|uniref:Type II secretory pathway, pseudopilin PulG n=1 Tax=Granulicatella balaenopterae TaxID=137733 RepID=A0A1H9L3V6_9LACT|nr:hypothetical protein [Granulicatella balaenopterae]SER05929.1 Type II secretory pathway, pseudopilin PulG [Granulicatella balaenopterae]
MFFKVQWKERGFVLFEAFCCLSITVVVLMLVSIAFLQITSFEEEKTERLNTFNLYLSDIKRIEVWSGIPVAIEQDKNSVSDKILPEEKYQDYDILDVTETITTTTKKSPSVRIPNLKIESEFLKEEFNYEITSQETIRLYID